MKAIALFGKMLAFSRLKINTNNLVQIHHEVATFLKKSTGSVPVVIDSSVDLDLVNLVDMLWALGIQPIGVIDGVL
ncbi:MAG: septum site-determining protein MinC, partial [Moraxella sp.]